MVRWIGFLEIFIVLIFSHYNVMTSCSSSNWFVHNNWVHAGTQGVHLILDDKINYAYIKKEN